VGFALPRYSTVGVPLFLPLQAPLMLGNDVRKMSSQTLSIISNKEVIAVNQGKGPLGP